MANLKNSKAVSIENGKLTFNQDADYSIDFTGNKVMIKQDGGQNTNVSDAQFATVNDYGLANLNNISLSGIAFTEADVAGNAKFEPDTNLDALLFDLIEDRGIAGTVDALTVNGSKADAFKLVWDHLDDQYSYYNTAINDAFIDLGIKYAQYLLDGGEALTDTVAKYIPDGIDALTAPDRLQSMHDNLLGNFDEASIIDKLGPVDGEAKLDEIDAAGLSFLIGDHGDYSDGRDYYGGNEGEDQTASQTFDNYWFFA